MTSPAQIADDILDSLMAMDGVDEADLIQHGIDGLGDKQREKLVNQIKEDNDWYTLDEAREHMEPSEGPED